MNKPMNRCAHTHPASAGWLAGALLVGAMGLPLQANAQTTVELPPVTVGAGMRTSFTSTDTDGAADDVNDFNLNSVRLYLSGQATETISFSFNTDYNASTNAVTVIDAVGQFAFSPQFNIWAGRFLPPSDRANLYGPYYANAWNFAADGVQDGFPFVSAGRNDGVAYWGNFSRLNVSLGVFDVPSTKAGGAEPSDTVFAGRLHLSLWDIESGYYLNGTYYGDKDILSFGVATHSISGDTAVTFDGLMEKKLGNAGVVTLEGEYATYEGAAGGYGSPVPFSESDGYFVLGAYLFPKPAGMGQFQVLAKLGTTTYDTAGGDMELETSELNLNYIIKAFNARLSLFYLDQSFEDADSTQLGLGLQLQM